MKPIEKYQRFGLETPITFRAGVKFHLLLWGGGSFLILGCIMAMADGDVFEQFIGAFGLVFFGLALGILIFALLRSGSHGLFEISKEGIYMSHIGVVLPWEDIGPAWIFISKHQGGKTKDVLFVLRNLSRHSARMGSIARLLMRISKKVAHSESGGSVEWGLKTIFFAADADSDVYDQLSSVLDRMRNSVIGEADTTVFNVPVPLRFGVSAEDLLAIINHEVASRNKQKFSGKALI